MCKAFAYPTLENGYDVALYVEYFAKAFDLYPSSVWIVPGTIEQE